MNDSLKYIRLIATKAVKSNYRLIISPNIFTDIEEGKYSYSFFLFSLKQIALTDNRM